MITINLLPWREQVRARKQWLLQIGLGGTSCLCLLFYLIMHYTLAQQMHTAKQHIHSINTNLQQLIEQAQKLDQFSQQNGDDKNLTHAEQLNKEVDFHILKNVASVMPKQAYLLRLSCLGAMVNLVGRAYAYQDVLLLIKAFSKVANFIKVDLIEMRSLENSSWLQFKIQITKK